MTGFSLLRRFNRIALLSALFSAPVTPSFAVPIEVGGFYIQDFAISTCATGPADVCTVEFPAFPEDLEALRLARRLGRAPGAELTLLHVVAPGNAAHPGKGRVQIDQELQVFAEPNLDSRSLGVRIVEHASPPDAVLEEAKRGYDLVVLGMNARWGLTAGRISLKRERVLVESPVSVLAVHPPSAAVTSSADSEDYVSSLADSSS